MSEAHIYINKRLNEIADGIKKLDALAPVNGDPKSLQRMQEQSEQIKEQILGSVMVLAAGVLGDINRIADALETIAEASKPGKLIKTD